MPRQVLVKLDNFQDGLAHTVYQGGKNQFAPGSRELDLTSELGIIQPVIKMGNDGGAGNTPAGRVVRAVIKAANGTYYWVGTNAVPELQVWTGSPEGSSDTTISLSGSGLASPTNMSEGSKLVEFDDDLFFYGSSTDLTHFDIATTTLTLDRPTGGISANNIGLDLLPYKSFLYYCNAQNVGRATSNAAADFNNTALALETRYRVTTLTPWQNFVIVGATTQNEGNTSRIFVWDGVSTNYDYSVDIPSNGLRAAINNNGIIYFFCVNNANGGVRRGNILYIYRWAGGNKIELVRELDLEGTSTNSFTVYPGAVDNYRGRVYFAIYAGTANTMGIQNGVYSIDHRGVLNLEFIDGATATPDTSDLNAFFFKWINHQPYWFFSDGTNDRREHWTGLTYSSDARLDTTALQFDPRYESRIDEIFFRSVSLPASTSVAVSIATDQAAFAAVKTFDADNAVANLIANQNDYAFQPGHTHQLRFVFTSATASRARIITPIYIKATIFDSQTLTS